MDWAKAAPPSASFHQSHEATDECQQHKHTGIIGIGEFRHEMLDDQLARGGQRTCAVQHHYPDKHATEKPDNDVAGEERQHEGNDEGERELASGSGIGAVNTEKQLFQAGGKSFGFIFDALPTVR